MSAISSLVQIVARLTHRLGKAELLHEEEKEQILSRLQDIVACETAQSRLGDAPLYNPGGPAARKPKKRR